MNESRIKTLALVSAIGISGTPRAKGGSGADEECAKAGREKIAGGLK